MILKIGYAYEKTKILKRVGGAKGEGEEEEEEEVVEEEEEKEVRRRFVAPRLGTTFSHLVKITFVTLTV
jgi:hypothetical protein